MKAVTPSMEGPPVYGQEVSWGGPGQRPKVWMRAEGRKNSFSSLKVFELDYELNLHETD